MRDRLTRRLAGLLPVALAALPAVANAAPDPEGPELAQPGSFAVGTATEQLAVARTPGTLTVQIWYPARTGTGTLARYDHVIHAPQRAPLKTSRVGTARVGAAPLAGQRFPLVLLSHGFGGWRTHMSRLAEHLASRGYVVVAPDHGDAAFDDVPGFLKSFGAVLAERSRDQRALLGGLVADRRRDGWRGEVDRTHIGLIGYSMGGYGALGTAGASYDPDAKTFAGLPSATRSALAEPSEISGKIGALVLIAPWGGQPDARVWTKASLQNVRMPVMLIDGDNDNVVNYAHGVSWLFDSLTGTDRTLLTLREARHNVAGDPAPAEFSDFDAREFFNEPVWRQERVNAVDQHFITAFLDRSLKGNSTAAPYLDVPTRVAGDGEWPLAFGTLLHGRPSGQGEPKYWRGFPRGWALGLSLDHAAAGTPGHLEANN